MPPSRFKERAGRALTIGAGWLGAEPRCVLTMIDGTVFELDARDRTQAGAFWNGSHEPDYLRVLRGVIDQFGQVVYDVGANVGLVAVPLARYVGTEGHVSCFEPVRGNCERLRRNIALNDLRNCVVHEVALGQAAGEIRMAREVRRRTTTGNAVIVNEQPNLPHYESITTVPIEPLDDVVRREDVPLPTVVKLDVEGAEVGFLAGAQRTLNASRPVILGEFNNTLMPKFGTTFLDAAALLPADYAIFGFVDANTIEEKPAAVGIGDVLLVPRERVAELRLRVR